MSSSSSQPKYSKLLNRHILIIGGSSGIGFAVAEASIESGARVTMSSSSSKKIAAAVDRLKASYPHCHVEGHPCDLSTEDVESNIVELFHKVGKVDHIVFTAGDHLANKPLSEIDLPSIKAAGHVRFFAPLLVAKYAPKYLPRGPEASIVLTTGSLGDHPMPDWCVVSGYAAALHGITRSLALELKPIRVNCVSPGAIETEMWDGIPKEARNEMMKGIAAKVPTGRIGQPSDVAESYLWLMKDANVTGFVASSNSGVLLV